MELDAGFVRRVLRTTAIVALLLAWMATAWFGWRIGLGLLAGGGLSLLSLASIDWIVRHLARPGFGARRRMALVFFGKIPALAALAGLVVWGARGSVPVVAAVAAGATLVPLVIVLKVLGRWLVASTAGR